MHVDDVTPELLVKTLKKLQEVVTLRSFLFLFFSFLVNSSYIHLLTLNHPKISQPDEFLIWSEYDSKSFSDTDIVQWWINKKKFVCVCMHACDHQVTPFTNPYRRVALVSDFCEGGWTISLSYLMKAMFPSLLFAFMAGISSFLFWRTALV